MSRSAADATRFTATGPYANARPHGPAYKLPSFMKNTTAQSTPGGAPGQHPGPGQEETPRQKVERLRAQARAARVAQGSSRVDRVIDVGREVANRAHKVMVYSLIAASGVCGALTVYSIISLTLYNRRQRALWLENELTKLDDAKRAHAAGTATAEQAEIVKNEMVGDIIKRQKEEERAQRPWNQAKRYLFGGLKGDDAVPGTTTTAAQGSGDGKPGVLEALNAKAAEDGKKPGSGSGSGPGPGHLDVLAENAETAAKQTTRSWTSWITGR